jgi:hypothetical protein
MEMVIGFIAVLSIVFSYQRALFGYAGNHTLSTALSNCLALPSAYEDPFKKCVGE